METSYIDNAIKSAQEDTTPEILKTRYKAFGINQSKDRQIKLCIRLKNGNWKRISYAHITSMEGLATGETLTIFCADCVFTIHGRGFQTIEEDLHDDKIRYIQEFNPTRFEKPLPNEPVITEITESKPE